MLRFVLRRALLAILILVGVSLVVFLTTKLIPGDPVAALLGPNSTAADRARLVVRLGLDRPLPVQYLSYLWLVLHGDLGRSIAQQTPVAGLIVPAFANTLLLAAFASVLAVVGGVALGAVAALRRQGVLAPLVSAAALFCVSAPQYVVAVFLIVLFAVRTSIFPAGGITTASGAGGFADLAQHLILPGVTAALVPMGIIARMFRSSLLDVLSQDFVVALRAHGLPPWKVLWHVMHNSMPSLLTISGLQVGYLLGGVVFVETVFTWPGLGLLIFTSISERDLPVIESGVLLSAFAFVAVNMVVDTAHAAIDPRVRN
jgi:peptide/nickel transport system permease protein